jgi:predicted porin
MKKSLLALAALTAFAGAASAQSSVTLFGILDVNAKRVTNETAAGSRSLASLSQDGIASSRLGFRGVEDIGGGVRAGFWLEAGLNPDTGGQGGAAGAAGTTTYNRRSTVSLMGGFGEIRLGRDYTPDFWNHTVYDPFGTNGVGNSTNTFTALNGATTLVRANNTIGYFLPALGGVFGQVQVAAGEGAAGNKHVGGRFGYAGGPVSVAVAFGRTTVTENPTVTWRRVNVGGSFNLGFMTLMAQYNVGEGSAASGPKPEIAHYLVGGAIPFGASTIKFSYVNSDGKGAIVNRDATQFAVGYQYDLSKRTAIYGTFARIANDGNAANGGATYTIGGGPAGQVAGKNSTGYEFGVRHTF